MHSFFLITTIWNTKLSNWVPCCVSGILLHFNSKIFTDDDTMPDLPYEVKNLDKPQGQNLWIKILLQS